MCIQSTIALKDFIAPITGLIGTIFLAGITYHGISIKIQKDRSVKWIEDFRKESTGLITHYSFASPLNPEHLKEAHSRMVTLIMFLNRDNTLHNQLTHTIRQALNNLSEHNSIPPEDISDILFRSLAVIREAEAEINKNKPFDM